MDDPDFASIRESPLCAVVDSSMKYATLILFSTLLSKSLTQRG